MAFIMTQVSSSIQQYSHAYYLNYIIAIKNLNSSRCLLGAVYEKQLVLNSNDDGSITNHHRLSHFFVIAQLSQSHSLFHLYPYFYPSTSRLLSLLQFEYSF